MANANQGYFDAQLRHQMGVRRFTSGEVKRALALIEKADRDLRVKLRARLEALGDGPIDYRSARWKLLVDDIKVARKELWQKLFKGTKAQGNAFSDLEVDFETRMMKAALPINIDFATVNLEQLHASLASTPFAGGANAARNLQQWFEGLATADQNRLIEALQLSTVQGESVTQAMARVAGTASAGYTNGVMALTARNAEAITRTFFNFVSNKAREATFVANQDIIEALKWNATLDGRTSATCRGRDGAFAPVGSKPLPRNLSPKLSPPGARPPAHPNCRSVMVAVFDPAGVMNKAGARPFVRSAQRRGEREKNFRQEAIAEVGGMKEWRKLSPGQRDGIIAKNRKNWATRNIGQVPPDVTYDDWMRRQPADFQAEVLGVTKAKLFRKGGLTLDKFIDRRGEELTLAQLAKTKPDAFINAGLDPGEF